MRSTLLITFTLALTLTACGADEKSSAGDDTGTAGTTEATTSPTTAPTSAASEAGSSSGGEPAVGVESTESMCLGNPGGLVPDDLHTPPLAAPTLSAKALGGGKITVTQTEYTENCGYSFTAVPEVTAANTITITYQAMGEIADCECEFTIDSTLTDLSPGTWTIASGDLTAMVDVT